MVVIPYNITIQRNYDFYIRVTCAGGKNLRVGPKRLAVGCTDAMTITESQSF